MNGADRSRRLSTSTVMLLIATAVVLYLLRAMLLPFVLPLIVAYVLEPLIRGITNASRLPRVVIATGMLILLIATAALVLWLMLPVLSRDLRGLGANFPAAVESLLNDLLHGRQLRLFGNTLSAADFTQSLMGMARRALTNGTGLVTVATLTIAVLFGTILSVVLLAYFLIDGPRIARGAFALIPPEHRAFVFEVMRRLEPVLRRYFIGVALVIAYASCAAYVGLGPILHMNHALVLALMTGVLELIPMVGPAASAVIVGLLATQQAQSGWGIAAFVMYAFALRLSIDQFFGPLVLGRAACVSPVVIIFSFLAGGLLFGIVGVIVAVPVALLIRTSLAVRYEY